MATNQTQQSPAQAAEPAAFVVATLNPLPASIGSTTITWKTPGNSWAEVYVSQDNGPETLFVAGPTGFKIAPWIQAGHVYEFRLYEGREHSKLLGSVTVRRNSGSGFSR